jgi:hypothetical protein
VGNNKLKLKTKILHILGDSYGKGKKKKREGKSISLVTFSLNTYAISSWVLSLMGQEHEFFSSSKFIQSEMTRNTITTYVA